MSITNVIIYSFHCETWSFIHLFTHSIKQLNFSVQAYFNVTTTHLSIFTHLYSIPLFYQRVCKLACMYARQLNGNVVLHPRVYKPIHDEGMLRAIVKFPANPYGARTE